MYLRPSSRSPVVRFEMPAHIDELYESKSRLEAEARLHHDIELKGIVVGHRRGRFSHQPPFADTSPLPCIPICIGWSYVSLTCRQQRVDMYKSIV